MGVGVSIRHDEGGCASMMQQDRMLKLKVKMRMMVMVMVMEAVKMVDQR